MRLAEGEMDAFVDERDALGVAEGFGPSEDGVFSLAGEVCVFERVGEFILDKVAIAALVRERRLAAVVLLLKDICKSSERCPPLYTASIYLQYLY